MALARNTLPDHETLDVRADFSDLACILVADDHRDRHCTLRPIVPSVDVNIRAADAGLVDLYENVIRPDLRDRPFAEPETGSAAALTRAFMRTPF